MKMSPKSFDLVWYADALLGVCSVFLLDRPSHEIHLLASCGLCLSGFAALAIGLFVERRSLSAIHQSPELEARKQIEIKPSNGEPRKPGYGRSIVINEHISHGSIKYCMLSDLTFTHVDSDHKREAHSYSEIWLSLNNQLTRHAGTVLTEFVETYRDPSSTRRHILREAREMARHLQGTEVDVIVTPENSIILRDVSATDIETEPGGQVSQYDAHLRKYAIN